MTTKQREEKSKDPEIERALKQFPKILARDERAARARKKIHAAFKKAGKKLRKLGIL